MEQREQAETAMQLFQDVMMAYHQPAICPFCGTELLISTKCEEFGPKYYLKDAEGKLVKFLYQAKCAKCHNVIYTGKGIGTQEGIPESENVIHLFD